MLGLAIFMAYMLDLLIGDPSYHFHPVRVIGRMISFYEVRLRELIPDERNAGMYLAFGLTLDVFLFAASVLWLSGQLSGMLQFGLTVFFIYSALSIKDLGDHAGAVQDALAAGNLGEARTLVSRVVGRDTRNLDEAGVARAAVETVAESTLDGIVSPLLYATLGGAPLALVFKAVSTMDSMIGYKNEKYEQFGKTAARLDDVMNYFPARLCPFFIALAALPAGGHFLKSISIGFRDGHKNPSPNSGYPQAAFGGALKLKLGGMSQYGGQLIEKPVLMEEGVAPKPEDIGRAVRLMYYTSFFAFLFFMALWYGFTLITMGEPG